MIEFSLASCLRADTETNMLGRECFAALLETPAKDKAYVALISALGESKEKYLAVAKAFDCKDLTSSRNQIMRFLNQFLIERTIVDRWAGSVSRFPFILHLAEIGMGFLSLSPAMKQLYDLIDQNKIEINTTGSNLAVLEDGAGNWKPDGKTSDGEMVALVMAIQGMMAETIIEQPIESVIWQIGKLNAKPDDVLVVRYHRPMSQKHVDIIAKQLSELTGLKVLVFDEPVDVSIISMTEPNE